METRILSDVLGIEVTGFNASQPLPATDKARILELFLKHHLIVVRDQNLSTEQQAVFSENFGVLEGHILRQHDGKIATPVHRLTNLGPDGKPTNKPIPVANYFWHTDKSYYEVPSLTTLLHAIEIPPTGGDTQFANMHLAYDALTAERQSELADLKVEHSWKASRRNAGEEPATEEEMRARPAVSHPLVRTHPETARKSLYMGIHTSHILTKPEAKGRAFLDELTAHATQPEFIYTHEWRPGDLVLWDNRSLLHQAVANFGMAEHRRVLHRTVVRGTKPF